MSPGQWIDDALEVVIVLVSGLVYATIVLPLQSIYYGRDKE